MTSNGHVHSAAHAGAGRLTLVLVLTASYTVIELAAGLITGSLALIADAGHMLTDVAGVSMALLAIKFSARPATPEKTYGYYRLEILAAIANSLLLFGLAGFVIYKAVGRFADPPDVGGLPVLGVAAVGLLINLVSASLLFHGQKTSLNLRGAFLEVVSDLAGSMAVLVAGIVLLVSTFKLIDPIVSVVISLFILPRTWKLVTEALHVLLEGVPRRLNIAHIEEHILEADGVTAVHDLHVWCLTSGMDVISAHVVIREDAVAPEVLNQLSLCLADHFGIEHCTFQIEQPDRSELEQAAH